MLRTGASYLDGLRDGRVVWLGAERVEDVTAHGGFRAAAHTVAELFDAVREPAARDDLVIDPGDGVPYRRYWAWPRSSADLEARRRCHQRISDRTFGLFGRSPDHVASLVTGLAMQADALGTPHADRLARYYRSARDRDAYVTYAVLPARGRSGVEGLRIVREDDRGVTLRGMKGIATAAVLADEIWLGNLQPLSPDRDGEAVTCVVSCAARGLELRARRAFALSGSDREYPLSARFDEGDAVVVLDDVHVAWDRVFVHRDTTRSYEIYTTTPAHALANHQAAVRSLSKVRLVLGLAHRIVEDGGTAEIAGVRENLGRLAAFEATLAGLVEAQIARCESWSTGAAPHRRYVYAALAWCQDHFPILIEILRDLLGSAAYRYPEGVGDGFVYKAAWDLVGSEFAGRHLQYERFYAGPQHVVRGHNFREAPWSELAAIVARLSNTDP